MDRFTWYYRQQPDPEWLQAFQDNIEDAQRNMILALTDTQGIREGLGVVQRAAGANFSVDIAAGIAFDTAGRRIENEATLNAPFVTDINGDPVEVETALFERIVSVYLRYVLEDDPTSNVVDGFGTTIATRQLESFDVVFVQGTEAAAGMGTPAAHPGLGLVKLADVTITNGDLSIVNADIDTSDRDLMTPFVSL